MSWPLAIPLDGATADDYLALLLRLLPDGYSDDPDGPRVTELEAYAHALWIGRMAIDRAIAQAFPDRATELVTELEAAYGLPNDAARTLEERQARLVAAERATAGAAMARRALSGVKGWSASDYYAHGATATMDGSSTMTRSVLLRLDTGGSVQALLDHITASTGWLLRLTASDEVEWRVRDSGGDTVVTSAALTVGIVYAATCSYDGSSVRLVVGQVASTPVAGTGDPASGGTAALGAQEGGSSPADGCTIIGAAASDSIALSDAEMRVHNARVMEAGQMLDLDGAAEHLYQAPNLHVDLIGSANWTVNGEPEATTIEQQSTRVSDALTKAAPSALAVVNARSHVEAAAAIDEMVFQIGVDLDAGDFDDPAVRRAISRTLRRILPARLHAVPRYRPTGGLTGPVDETEHLYVHEGAWWGSTEATLGRDVLGRQDENTRAIREPACRYREYGGLTRLEADDLNALQDLTLMGPAEGAGVADAYAAAGDDMAIVHFAVSVGATASASIDKGLDWLDRYVMMTLRYDTADIRPGQAGDTTFVSSAFTEMWSTLDGDDGTLTGDFITLTGGDLSFYADDVDGQLKVYNSTGSTQYVVGTCIASPDLGKR